MKKLILISMLFYGLQSFGQTLAVKDSVNYDSLAANELQSFASKHKGGDIMLLAGGVIVAVGVNVLSAPVIVGGCLIVGVAWLVRFGSYRHISLAGKYLKRRKV